MALVIVRVSYLPCYFSDSAGNFLCPADSLSSNAYRNVIDIDTVGTFTVSKAVFSAYFKVCIFLFLRIRTISV